MRGVQSEHVRLGRGSVREECRVSMCGWGGGVCERSAE